MSAREILMGWGITQFFLLELLMKTLRSASWLRSAGRERFRASKTAPAEVLRFPAV